MGKVIDIDCYEPHLTGELICLQCGYRYIGTWNEKVWLKELYCPNCQIQGFTIATGQILESYYDENRPEPMPQSKPGQIVEFPPKISGQKLTNIIQSNKDMEEGGKPIC